jgi:signal transduction histidine kinase
MAQGDNTQEQLASISVEIAALHELRQICDRALGYCLTLTGSEFAFTGLLQDANEGVIASGQAEVSDQVMDIAAIKGFSASSDFYRSFHLMALRSSVVGVVIKENRSYVANDVDQDPHSVGQPSGHPAVRRFLGAPLRLGANVIGMIGVANKQSGYDSGDERLLTTLAGQVAVAVGNARLYQRQRQTIAELQQKLHERLTELERAQLLGRERQRIAGALHDHIEQEIFLIGVRLRSLLEDRSIEARLAQEIQELRRLAISAADEVRRAIFHLNGEEELGNLTDDIRSLVQEFQHTSGIGVHLSVSGSPTAATEAVHDVVHLVVREALTNVVRHASATVVLVSLRHEAARLEVVVQDDGTGAPETLLRTFPDSYLHFGLRHIRQAVIDRGGSLEVTNGDEVGLVVRASIPYPTEPA